MKNKVMRSGFYIALSGVIIFLGIQTAEMNYLGEYSTNRDYISELGVNNSGAAIVFNLSMMASGILIILGARRLHKHIKHRFFTLSLTFHGVGIFGVGLFTGDVGILHGIFAILLFITGPMAAIASRKHCTKMVARLSLIFALVSIFFSIALAVSPEAENVGGVERWALYPLTMWLIVFGSYIVGASDHTSKWRRDRDLNPG